MSRPNGTIATSGLELLTFGTPNGHKASIVLEEIKEAYGKPDYVYVNHGVVLDFLAVMLTGQCTVQQLPEHQHRRKHPERAMVYQVRAQWQDPGSH